MDDPWYLENITRLHALVLEERDLVIVFADLFTEVVTTYAQVEVPQELLNEITRVAARLGAVRADIAEGLVAVGMQMREMRGQG
jgi:hypothetical protein